MTASADVEVDVAVTTATPIGAPPPDAGSIEPGPAPLLLPRLELRLGEGDHEFVSWGSSVLLGAEAGRGFLGGLVLGYLADLGASPSEIDLALEVQKDFAPLDPFAVLLVARAGTAFMVPNGDPLARGDDSGIRVLADLGVGGRIQIHPLIAIVVDLRGALRYRPGPLGEVSAGIAMTFGLRFRLE